MRTQKAYNSAIFDCDGVILDSNNLKTEAFRKCLHAYEQDIVDRFISYHQANGGISRQIKLRTFLEEFADEPANLEDSTQQLLHSFAQHVVTGLQEAPLVDGVLTTLQQLRQQDTQCFVLSGGSQQEIIDTFNARGIADYFNSILGNPRAKLELAQELKASNILGENVVYFGDAELDYEIALMLNAQFVFVARHSDWQAGAETLRGKDGVVVVQDFREFNRL